MPIAKLFSHGGSQAVRLPKAFRFEGEAVRISRVGARVILEPQDCAPGVSWAEIDALGDPDFMREGRAQPAAADERDPLDP